MRFVTPDNNNTRRRRLAALILMATLTLAALPPAPAAARTPTPQLGGLLGGVTGLVGKLASDLLPVLTGTASRDTRVRVVVQFDSPVSATLALLLGGGDFIVRDKLTSLNTWVVEAPADKLGQLASFAEVSFVSRDSELRPFGHVTETTGADDARKPAGLSLSTVDGRGVGIAVLDSGVHTNHRAFLERNLLGQWTSRVVFSKDFTGEGRTDDPYGHGTHVASAAAGNGSLHGGDYAGVAPGASIVNLRVLNSQGVGSTSSVLRALDWLMANRARYNVRVVNMSIGTPAVVTHKQDPLCRAVRRLHDAGVVVVAAAGNLGKDKDGQKVYGHVHAPGNDPSVITVGASNTYGTDARDDDSVATYSSRGPARAFYADASGVKHYDNNIKPDLVAPGNKIIFAAAPGNLLLRQNPQLEALISRADPADSKLMYMSGTSVSAPVVAGAAALMIQTNPTITPNMVKAFMMYTAQQLKGANTFEQGAGQLNVEGAVRLARTLRLAGLVISLSSPPAPRTSVAGKSFQWSQGLLLDHAWATGPELLTRYQWAYAANAVLNDGVREFHDAVERNPERMTAGVTVGAGVMVSDGTVLGSGDLFFPTSLLLGDGVMVSDGVMCSDGVMVSDGIMLSDGVMCSDAYAQATRALIGGDDTASMF